MSLSINQNIMAMNSYRNLSVTQGGLAKSLEKLSSGFRINRAADDAAGLAISEGLRSQVGGNRQAVRNAQDGISLVQTAEGALNEVHSILQRMRTLAVQGATDSNSPEARNNINTELNQLREELDRIGKVTNFNGTELLNGSASGANALKFQVGANGDPNNRITVDLKDADVTAVAKFAQNGKVSQVKTAETAEIVDAQTYTFNLDGKSFSFDAKKTGTNLTDDDIVNSLRAALVGKNIGFVSGGKAEAGETEGTAIVTEINKAVTAKNNAAGSYTLKIDGKDYTYKADAGAAPRAVVDGLNGLLKNSGYELEADQGADKAITKFKLKATQPETQNKQVEFSMTYDDTSVGGNGADIKTAVEKFKGYIGEAHGTGYKFSVKGSKITFERADGKNMDVDLAHSVTQCTTAVAAGKGKGVDEKDVLLTVKDAVGGTLTYDKYTKADVVNALTVKDHDSAQNLIRILDKKIQSVSTARSNLGAVQNRFEHTITNLNVAVENLAASESRVRDTDMAQEMMQFTRNQILSQAGTSMLAQANQVPQGVLSLLR
ncbi:flagellin N-terminal helical domain-containing protein [Mobiluncus mulieris]|uniref:flagellin N-terminal helical domain-containing protein n=1 Tax=Mobiluncus mulieris TaxID=2052 RepID=UPI000DFA60DC|nr:flagellin [Mobiluncus mulieris]STY83449.1 Flagellin [Mobiluncus mulieris]